MLNDLALEDTFEDRGEYFQHRQNANITMQIVGRSRDFRAVADALREKRD